MFGLLVLPYWFKGGSSERYYRGYSRISYFAGNAGDRSEVAGGLYGRKSGQGFYFSKYNLASVSPVEVSVPEKGFCPDYSTVFRT